MKMPIPRPKKFCSSGSYVPAIFTATDFDPRFEPAVRVFRRYAFKAFGGVKTEGGLILKMEDSLGNGYRISVGNEIVLSAANNTGMNYAFATLLQLVEEREGVLCLPCCEIEDCPDNGWRGLMLDLARCYHEAEYLFAVADLCWLYKINRYQLHLTDDQGIRFPFSQFPDAVSEEHYAEKELKELIRYCRDRGIVIVPEIDAPGHARAFNRTYPQFFGTAPKTSDAETTAQAGVISGIMRADDVTFDVLNKMFKEVADLFSDSPWIHIGGDEADIKKWDECPVSVAYREAHGLKNIHELYGHYVARLSQMILDLGRTPVVWEGFAEECNHMIPKETLVIAWESYYQLAPQLLKGGFDIINVAWMPLYIVPHRKMWDPEVILDWEKNVWTHWWEKSVASVTPVEVPKDSPILGGQMCVWGDAMSPKNAFAPRHDMIREEFGDLRLRLPALAEKVWSSYNNPDKDAFKADFAHHDRLLSKIL